MKKLIAFLVWIPQYFGSKLLNIHKEYLKLLRDEPALGFVLMIFITALFFILSLILTLAIFGVGSAINVAVAAFTLLALPVEYVYVQLAKLYQIFNKERQDTFDALK